MVFPKATTPVSEVAPSESPAAAASDGASLPYVILPTAHKGMAMFASRAIPAGSLIVREKPLIVMPDAVFSMEDQDRLETWLDRRLNKLTSEGRTGTGEADSAYCNLFLHSC